MTPEQAFFDLLFQAALARVRNWQGHLALKIYREWLHEQRIAVGLVDDPALD
jgi:hypothetical protein